MLVSMMLMVFCLLQIQYVVFSLLIAALHIMNNYTIASISEKTVGQKYMIFHVKCFLRLLENQK